jgi:predicted negative regulator of RcsB-dependent stress response
MRPASTNKFLLAMCAVVLLCIGVIGYRAYHKHRAAQEAAVVEHQLDRLAAPAPRRAPVSLRPGAR